MAGPVSVDRTLGVGVPKSPVQGVQCIHKALELLCSFTPDHSEWGVTELAAYLGIAKSAAHRILVTCEQYRFVERTADRRYRLGARLLELGNVYRFDRRLLAKAETSLQSLARTVSAIAHLGELEGYSVLELMRAEALGSVRFHSSPKFRMSAHATALGKVLLAFSAPEFRERYFSRHRHLVRFTSHTLVDEGDLRREIDSILQRDYAVSNEESVLGCRCIAVAIRNRNQHVAAALSISGPVERFTKDRIPELAAHLWRTARLIEREL